ncbi:xylulokinase [Mycobacterium sp. 94-17]|uniref:xylulokinase n=1 Tax=Mycobacterium sp. 94-17 TaxID=2986147 RepID=UPI002D1EBD9B|nr:FGGY-family carbohydrate kinase [Mycobacterium sp. 94-17]MEB4208200.1 FGGY-family carbohydrate kinase [Mycobacterium sp. 94-17]
MSRKDVTIGIDVGSTAVKAIAADADGNVTGRVRIPHELRVPAPDLLEHDAAAAWLRGPSAACDELVHQPGVAAVAVAAMVPSMTAVDAGGTPVTPGLLYGDGRGRTPDQQAQPLPALGEAAEFLRWTAGQAPGAAGYWSAPAVANHALSGQAVIDIATAATAFPLFDGTGWDPGACAERGADVHQMPRVQSMGAVVGQVRGTDAALATGAIDALCEQMVAGADRDGDVLVMCGTTLIVWTTISEPRQMPGLWTIPHTVAGKSQIGGASNAGGLFLGWVDRVVAPADPTAAEPGRVPVWAPYLRGERTPFHDRDRRGVLEALDLTHDAAALRRAAYEASGFVVRRLIELGGAPVSRIVATGGGTRVGPWLQAIADATGRPVEVSGVAEGAALGAAFLARMAVGLETTIADAARWARTECIVEPDPAWAGAVEDRYQRFLELGNHRCSAVPPPAF